MKRTILDSQRAAWLAATIERNRRFAGLRMADDGGDGSSEDGENAGVDGVGEDDDEPLGEGGKKALDAERTARKAAEDRLKAIEGDFEGFKKALAEGLGIKSGEGEKGEDALAAVQAQVASMQHEAAVLRLANQHKITDPEDLALLASTKDAEGMKKLAERLAPADDTDDGTKPRRPKPDPTQGGGAGEGDNSGVSHGRDLFKQSRRKSS